MASSPHWQVLRYAKTDTQSCDRTTPVGHHGYRASKAALNSFIENLAVDMNGDGALFVVLHPGYVKADMNEGAGNITAAESAAGLYTVITGLDEADDGKFFNFDGKPMPW